MNLFSGKGSNPNCAAVYPMGSLLDSDLIAAPVLNSTPVPVSSGRWMPDPSDVVRGQFGDCLEWAFAHQKAYPELSLGVHKYERDGETVVEHFFTHDAYYAYDTNGVHRLPYVFYTPDEDAAVYFADNGFESSTEHGLDLDSAKAVAALSGMELNEAQAPSQSWIFKFAPDPNFPPDVPTPSEPKPSIDDIEVEEDSLHDWN